MKAARSRLGLAVLSAFALASLAAGAAGAQEVAGGAELRSVTMGQAQLEITVPVVINASSNSIGNPINIPVDAYYGLRDDLTIGISHSGGTFQGVNPYGRALGICVTSNGGCPSAYNNLGGDALYRVMSGVVQVAAHGGFAIRSFSESKFELRAGALLKAPLGTDVAVLIDPRLVLRFDARDKREGETDGQDRHRLNLPLGLQFMTDAGIRLCVLTGIDGALTGDGDDFFGWLGALASMGVNEKMEAFVSFTLNDLYGAGLGVGDWGLVLGFNIRP